MSMTDQELRKLPSVDRLLQESTVVAARAEYGHGLTHQATREVLDAARRAIQDAGQPCPELPALAQAVLARLEALTRPTLRPVINATGVLVHTNLGRAPLSDAAQTAMQMAGGGYSNLEYDLDAGQRGSRYVHAVDLLRRLTGAEDALVVNNNAAAVLLCLMALARDREVIISRGQLVEIGGGFRIPDVLRTSGARLVEVGTTNRTHLRDYEEAIGPATAMLLRVHSSNFRQIGFTAEVSLAELVALGHTHGLPVVDDLGSGTLLDTTAFGLAYEPRVQDSVQAGATLVTFSGDKLLGGPQAGLIVGQKDAIAQLRSHPLTRALRVDKTTLAGLAATLGHYLRGEAVDDDPGLAHDQGYPGEPGRAQQALGRSAARQRFCDPGQTRPVDHRRRLVARRDPFHLPAGPAGPAGGPTDGPFAERPACGGSPDRRGCCLLRPAHRAARSGRVAAERDPGGSRSPVIGVMPWLM